MCFHLFKSTVSLYWVCFLKKKKIIFHFIFCRIKYNNFSPTKTQMKCKVAQLA